MRLEGRTVIVTGAAQGIGRATALAFASEGANVVLADVADAEGTAAEARRLGRSALVAGVDVTSRDQVGALMERARAEFGRVDVLVNNAGVVRPALLTKMTEEQWDTVIDVHMKGTFFCIQAVAPIMMEQQSGRIVNVSSLAGYQGTFGQINYGAAKAGIIGITKSAARELARYNITVNAICPGVTETRMTETILTDPRFADKYRSEIALGRTAKPEEIARCIVFLGSDDSSFVTGAVLHANGGMDM